MDAGPCPSAVLLPSGHVLIVSGVGYQERGALDLRAEIYDPASRTFAATSTPVSTNPRIRGDGICPTATLLHDGRVLVTWTSTLAELYDPIAGTFSATGGMLTTPVDGRTRRPCSRMARSSSPVALLSVRSTLRKCTSPQREHSG